MKKKRDGYYQEHICNYCRVPFKFKHWMTEGMGEGHSRVNSAVQCPQCRNFLRREGKG